MLRHFFAFIAIATILSSCNRNSVSIDFTNAKDEVPQLGNLTFRFTKSLIPDSLLNRWDSTEYISFEPAIAGRFRWEHPDELVFSPAKPLMPATSYTTSFNKILLKHSKYNKIKNADDITFKTADLQLDN